MKDSGRVSGSVQDAACGPDAAAAAAARPGRTNALLSARRGPPRAPAAPRRGELIRCFIGGWRQRRASRSQQEQSQHAAAAPGERTDSAAPSICYGGARPR
ncbi:hypothetical protein E2C01_084814 [Portunus trituberculatus]|uniref:Uncharacterized protein n=1 Tax=Portunus trituberculatus TaxID=210409 RepID=A0A5B7IWB5_PORTR|nr:hypothetical protein [Portunus trituberculatus]